jgi:uncharacterized protein (DUF1778 family)
MYVHLTQEDSMAAQTKTKRRQLRVSPEDDRVIAAAAEATSRSVSEYLIESALVRARSEMADRTEIELSPVDWNAFLRALENESAVNDRLVRAVARAEAAGS